jgi:hypothetical protein
MIAQDNPGIAVAPSSPTARSPIVSAIRGLINEPSQFAPIALSTIQMQRPFPDNSFELRASRFQLTAFSLLPALSALYPVFIPR